MEFGEVVFGADIGVFGAHWIKVACDARVMHEESCGVGMIEQISVPDKSSLMNYRYDSACCDLT